MALSKTQLLAILVVIIVVVAAVAVVMVSGDDDDDSDSDSGDASSSSTASSEETRLNICGNANLDSYLDEDDIEYIQGIIDGTNEATILSDVDQDGDYDDDDIALLESIIDFTADEVWYLDLNGNYAHIIGDIESVAVQYWPTLQAFCAIGAYDLVDYSDSSTLKQINNNIFGQTMIDAGVESFGTGFGTGYDFETMMSLGVDAIACGSSEIYFIGIEDMYSSDAYINMIRLPFWEEDNVVSSYLTLAYILGVESYVENAYAYLEHYNTIMEILDEGLSKVTDVKSVLVTYYSADDNDALEVEIECAGSGSYECSVMAGLDNLASDIAGGLSSDTMYYTTDIEYLYDKDPDYIIMLHSSGLNYTSDDQQTSYETWSAYLTELECYQNQCIYVSSSSLTSGLFQADLALMIACAVYADAFEDVDPYYYLQELVDNFTLLNYGVTSSSDDYFDVTVDGAYLHQGQI